MAGSRAGFEHISTVEGGERPMEAATPMPATRAPENHIVWARNRSSISPRRSLISPRSVSAQPGDERAPEQLELIGSDSLDT